MWWKKGKNKKDQYLVPHRNELNVMVSTFLKQAHIDFDVATSLEQALVGTFIFGMISTHGMMHKLTPPDVHALALSVFMDSLHYTVTAAAQGVEACINATSPGYHDTMNAVLHRGIDGYKQYKEGDLLGLAQNMESILDHFKKLDKE
jgi:hypothetical protein